ncbi:UNVERIFIED_ORG: hypothetical protein J2X79_003454 [Arthrobacter globiformis]|nr:hypothetical protein [Arthrobacter globiformis]
MNITGSTRSRGRFCHSVISPTTFSVIGETVSLETLTPKTSAKWAAISPVVSTFAVSDSTISSTPVSRR